MAAHGQADDDGEGGGNAEHVFAEFLRTIGRGPGRGRSLTREEARDAFSRIIDGTVAEIQLGAFLLLLRYRGESPEELAGFDDAVRAAHGWPEPGTPKSGTPEPGTQGVVDLDWPSYATGAPRGAPWFVLAGLLAAGSGLRVLMHGFNGAGAAQGAEAGVRLLGLPVARSLGEAMELVEAGRFAYLPLRNLSPALLRLMELRPLLGLRTPVNSLLKLINPAAAPASVQGVFHPPYLDLHARTSVLIGQPRSAVFKGGRGEAERNPLKPVTVRVQAGAATADLEWPALFGASRGEKPPQRPLEDLAALWRGEIDDPVAAATVTATAAVALAAANPGLDPDRAQELAHGLWKRRHSLF